MTTFPQLFAETVAAHPDRTALRWKVGDAFAEWTWTDYAERVARVAAALRDLGVGHGDRVVLMLRNRPEFHIADVGGVAARRDAGVDLQLLRAGTGGVPRRPLGGRRRDRRGHRLPRTVPQGAQRAARAAPRRHRRRPRRARAGRRAPVERDARRSTRCRSTPSSATRVPTTSSRSSTPREPPDRRRA